MLPLLHINPPDTKQLLIVAAVAKIGESPFERAVPASVISGNHVRPNAISQVDLLSGALETGQNDFVMV